MPIKNKQERHDYNARYWAANKERELKRRAAWIEANPGKYREYEVKRKDDRAAARKHMRLLALNIVGGCCARCGIDDWRVLHIDHVIPLLMGKGRPTQASLYKAIVMGEARGLQVLCANCHEIKTYEEGSRRMARDKDYRASIKEAGAGVYQ